MVDGDGEGRDAMKWSRRGDGAARVQALFQPVSPAPEEASDDAGIAGEVLDFLQGRSLERFQRSGVAPVPEWSYINVVTYAEPEYIRQLAAVAPPEPLKTATWLEVVTVMARDLLELAGVGADDRTIRTLQIECLLPLEDRLIASAGDQPIGPARALAMARSFLRGHPSRPGC
jgi:hypothetical protein